jgi:two-component system, sensor histidine kinase and response regulator
MYGLAQIRPFLGKLEEQGVDCVVAGGFAIFFWAERYAPTDVMLRVWVESVSVEKQCLHFSITDTRIGILPANQARIFEIFTQADGSTTRIHGGTGLGLTIAAQLVGQMSGRIWVESTLETGTTFHFTAHFPMRDRPIADGRIDPFLLKGLRVLVVDDNQINRRILRTMLESLGDGGYDR